MHFGKYLIAVRERLFLFEIQQVAGVVVLFAHGFEAHISQLPRRLLFAGFDFTVLFDVPVA